MKARSAPVRLGAAVILGLLSTTAGDASSALSKSPVPATLVTLESSAEDIVDFALGRDRASVLATAGVLRRTARGPAAAALTAAGARPVEISELERRATRLTQLARAGAFTSVALAANAISGLMPGLYAHFADRVPPAVLRLDYLDREIQLRSLARAGHAPSLVAELSSTWAPLRAKVRARGGVREANAFDRHVAAMKRLEHTSGKRLQAEAVNGLGLVDEIEAVFRG